MRRPFVMPMCEAFSCRHVAISISGYVGYVICVMRECLDPCTLRRVVQCDSLFSLTGTASKWIGTYWSMMMTFALSSSVIRRHIASASLKAEHPRHFVNVVQKKSVKMSTDFYSQLRTHWRGGRRAWGSAQGLVSWGRGATSSARQLHARSWSIMKDN